MEANTVVIGLKHSRALSIPYHQSFGQPITARIPSTRSAKRAHEARLGALR